MNNNKDFNHEIIVLIEDTLNWAYNFQRGKRDYKFNPNDKIYFLLEKNKLSYNENILLIDNLLDFYCDAIEHGFNKIDDKLKTSDLKKIIIEVKDWIKKHNSLDFNEQIVNKLKLI